MAKAKKGEKKATVGAAGETAAFTRKFVLDLKPVEAVPARTRENSLVKEIIDALTEAKPGSYSVGKYENPGSAAATVRALRKAFAESGSKNTANGRHGEVFVTVA